MTDKPLETLSDAEAYQRLRGNQQNCYHTPARANPSHSPDDINQKKI